MTLKVISNDGIEHEYTDVYAVDFIDKDYVENVRQLHDLPELSDAQIESVGYELGRYSDYPNEDCILHEIRKVLED